MKSLRNYPVNFPYGATSYPYSVSNPHHGDDRAAPTGTPIVVSGKQIGLVGSTGFSSGPHCHIDKNKQLWVTSGYRRPTSYFSLRGRVVFAGAKGTAGNCVVIKTNDGWYYRYLHMSRITCKVGDKIGVEMVTLAQEKMLYRFYLGKDITEAGKKAVGKKTFASEQKRILGSTAYKTRIKQAKDGKLVCKNHLPSSLRGNV